MFDDTKFNGERDKKIQRAVDETMASISRDEILRALLEAKDIKTLGFIISADEIGYKKCLDLTFQDNTKVRIVIKDYVFEQQ